MIAKWKCTKCLAITEANHPYVVSICSHCKQSFCLERYDDKHPDFFKEKESPL